MQNSNALENSSSSEGDNYSDLHEEALDSQQPSGNTDWGQGHTVIL